MFRFSHVGREGQLSVSKWLSVQVLLSAEEMKELLDSLGELLLVPVGRVVPRARPLIEQGRFLEVYSSYVEALSRGEELEPRSYLSDFSPALSLGSEEFYAIEVDPLTMLVKPILPVVQMQPHSMGYSFVDHMIYPMARGPESISWGVQLSFPTLYQAPRSSTPSNTLKGDEFRNSAIFQKIQQWMRRHTRPTPMMIRGKVVNIPVRLGHRCFSWVNNHPMLRFHGLLVDNEGDEG